MAERKSRTMRMVATQGEARLKCGAFNLQLATKKTLLTVATELEQATVGCQDKKERKLQVGRGAGGGRGGIEGGKRC